MNEEPKKPGLSPQKAADKARREERLAASLRENLKRRKALQRARAAGTHAPARVDDES